MRGLLESLEDRHYAERSDAFFGASIGAHVRHSIDHVESLARSLEATSIEYDHRDRGTEVETDRGAGIRALDRAAGALRPIERRDAEDSLEMRALVDSAGDTVTTRSTWAREVVFTLSHTIHHAALISAMARLSGARVPEGFGLAPSTLRHLDSEARTAAADDSSCAR